MEWKYHLKKIFNSISIYTLFKKIFLLVSKKKNLKYMIKNYF